MQMRVEEGWSAAGRGRRAGPTGCAREARWQRRRRLAHHGAHGPRTPARVSGLRGGWRSGGVGPRPPQRRKPEWQRCHSAPRRALSGRVRAAAPGPVHAEGVLGLAGDRPACCRALIVCRDGWGSTGADGDGPSGGADAGDAAVRPGAAACSTGPSPRRTHPAPPRPGACRPREARAGHGSRPPLHPTREGVRPALRRRHLCLNLTPFAFYGRRGGRCSLALPAGPTQPPPDIVKVGSAVPRFGLRSATAWDARGAGEKFYCF